MGLLQSFRWQMKSKSFLRRMCIVKKLIGALVFGVLAFAVRILARAMEPVRYDMGRSDKVQCDTGRND